MKVWIGGVTFLQFHLFLSIITEYSHNTDPSSLQRGLKLILKVGPNNTPEYSGDGVSLTSTVAGPPTAAEAMCSSPLMLEDMEEYREKHKKSKKKKKKKDREKKHKHHKEKKRDKGERHISESPRREASSVEHIEDLTLIASQDSQSLPGCSSFQIQRSPKILSAGPPSNIPFAADGDSSQDGFSFMDDDASQPLPENILLYANMTTESSPSCRPVSKPIVPIKIEDTTTMGSPASSSIQSTSLAATPSGVVAGNTTMQGSPVSLGGTSPTKPLSEVSDIVTTKHANSKSYSSFLSCFIVNHTVTITFYTSFNTGRYKFCGSTYTQTT